MTTSPKIVALTRVFIRPLVVCLFLMMGIQSVTHAADQVDLTASLIWGTDKESTPGPNLGPVSQKLQAKFSNIFKWKRYFLISHKSLGFPQSSGKPIQLSPTCEIKVRILDDGDMLEVRLQEKDQPLRTLKHPLQPIQAEGELFVIAGDDRDSSGDAWFVVLGDPNAESKTEESQDDQGGKAN